MFSAQSSLKKKQQHETLLKGKWWLFCKWYDLFFSAFSWFLSFFHFLNPSESLLAVLRGESLLSVDESHQVTHLCQIAVNCFLGSVLLGPVVDSWRHEKLGAVDRLLMKTQWRHDIVTTSLSLCGGTGVFFTWLWPCLVAYNDAAVQMTCTLLLSDSALKKRTGVLETRHLHPQTTASVCVCLQHSCGHQGQIYFLMPSQMFTDHHGDTSMHWLCFDHCCYWSKL